VHRGCGTWEHATQPPIRFTWPALQLQPCCSSGLTHAAPLSRPPLCLAPSHTAALYGAEACVEALLEAGARVDELNSEDGTSVLHDAAAGGYTTIMRILIDAARKQMKKGGGDGAGGSGEGGAAAERRKEEEEEEEGDGGGHAPPRSVAELVDARDSEGETALHNAARGNHVEAVRYLLALGADPFIAANDGTLAVEEAEDEGVAAIVQEAMDAIEEGEDEEEEEEEEEAEGQGTSVVKEEEEKEEAEGQGTSVAKEDAAAVAAAEEAAAESGESKADGKEGAKPAAE
jgi:ankyrin repeat protein